MSMKILTILQFIEVLGLYSLMTVIFPAMIFYRKFHSERLYVRFFFYLTIGNFYLMNLVFLLQLLHISNRFTLILGTVIPAAYAFVKVNDIPVKRMAVGAVNTIFKISRGTMGVRLLLKKGMVRVLNTAGGFGKRVVRSLKGSFLEGIFLLCFIMLLLWIYGSNMLETYGFCKSDIPVHHYWINNMGKNRIFVAGVYPFGFHCIIYYLHTVFSMETYVLLRVFGVVQTLYIHIILLAFMKVFLKTRYTAYAAAFLYVGASFFNIYTYDRYYSSLPQEFGMIFILPSIYFLFAFLEDRKKEVDKEKESGMQISKREEAEPAKSTGIGEQKEGADKKLKFGLKNFLSGRKQWKHSTIYLAWFAMCFSMTLAVHFYGTMIAGLFCVGIAAGYALRLFRREYFGRVMLAGIISILLAVLPMGAAFAMGTPLQGSLGWGMEVITGKQEEEQDEELSSEEEMITTETGTWEGAGGEEAVWDTETGNFLETGSTDDTGGDPNGGQADRKEHVPFGERVRALADRTGNFLNHAGINIWMQFKEYIMPKAGPLLRAFVFAMPVVLLLLGIIFLLAKKRDYGAMLLSVAFFMLLMFVLFGAEELSIPNLMNKNRSSIYLCYMMPVAFGFLSDGILWGITGWMHKKILINGASLLVSGGLIGMLVWSGQIKQPEILTGFETNGAITCLTNILRDNEDWTFTICSANDELRMVEDYGYHYETITFLKDMEGEGVKDMLTLPTERVYFFIEKKPLDYDKPYEDSGQMISEEGAANALPSGSGLSIYQARNRWIVMSRMYYWAEAFRNLYENEMRVYYETDDFICYEVEQNTYRLYDFSIDYGYNTAID